MAPVEKGSIVALKRQASTVVLNGVLSCRLLFWSCEVKSSSRGVFYGPILVATNATKVGHRQLFSCASLLDQRCR